MCSNLLVDEPLCRHTTFQVGGPADLFVVPRSIGEVQQVLRRVGQQRLSLFVLGGGSNILVSDRGVRGIVMGTSGFDELRIEDERLLCGTGRMISEVAAASAERGLRGLQFLYSMPGSVGGAIWMNARCYGHEIVEVLEWVEMVTDDSRIERYRPKPQDFGYKRSPFQTNTAVIVSACFRLERADPDLLRREMQEIRADRERKGHFSGPSVGSIFKNDRAFGSPSGILIDRLGLRGLQIGGARISDLHANIIVNTGDATAEDIRALIELIARSVRDRLGFNLEREVLSVGEWD